MRDSVKWRKEANIVMILAKKMNVSPEEALKLFFSSDVYKLFSDPSTGLQLMSDEYISEDLLKELCTPQ